MDSFRITGIFGSQDLQRRLDQERAERNKTDSATLKLLSELKEDSQKANELRDQESRWADKQLSEKSCYNRLVCCCVISTSQSVISFRGEVALFRLAKRALLARVFKIPRVWEIKIRQSFIMKILQDWSSKNISFSQFTCISLQVL